MSLFIPEVPRTSHHHCPIPSQPSHLRDTCFHQNNTSVSESPSSYLFCLLIYFSDRRTSQNPPLQKLYERTWKRPIKSKVPSANLVYVKKKTTLKGMSVCTSEVSLGEGHEILSVSPFSVSCLLSVSLELRFRRNQPS